VSKNSSGKYKHIYFHVIHNNNKTHNIKCYNLIVLGYMFTFSINCCILPPYLDCVSSSKCLSLAEAITWLLLSKLMGMQWLDN